MKSMSLGLATLSVILIAHSAAQTASQWIAGTDQIRSRAVCVERALSSRLNPKQSMGFMPAWHEQEIPQLLRNEQFESIGGHVNAIYFVRLSNEATQDLMREVRRNHGRFVTRFGSLHIRRYAIRSSDADGVQEVFVLAHLDRANPYSGANGAVKHLLLDVVYGNLVQSVGHDDLDERCE